MTFIDLDVFGMEVNLVIKNSSDSPATIICEFVSASILEELIILISFLLFQKKLTKFSINNPNTIEQI